MIEISNISQDTTGHSTTWLPNVQKGVVIQYHLYLALDHPAEEDPFLKPDDKFAFSEHSPSGGQEQEPADRLRGGNTEKPHRLKIQPS